MTSQRLKQLIYNSSSLWNVFLPAQGNNTIYLKKAMWLEQPDSYDYDLKQW